MEVFLLLLIWLVVDARFGHAQFFQCEVHFVKFYALALIISEISCDIRHILAVRYPLYGTLSLVQFLVPVLGHHERKATHQERTELGKARFLKPYQDTAKDDQHKAEHGGLPVTENPIDHF